MRLSDEEIGKLEPVKDGYTYYQDYGRAIADAQLAKCKEHYASLTDEKVRKEVGKLICHNCPIQYRCVGSTDKLCYDYPQTIDHILSLFPKYQLGDNEELTDWETQDEIYQGIAKPVYDIIGNHIPCGGKVKDGIIILHIDHHKLSFEIQTQLRELGYRKIPGLKENEEFAVVKKVLKQEVNQDD